MRKKDRNKAQRKKKARVSKTIEEITGVEEKPETVVVEPIEQSKTHDPNCTLCKAMISGDERLYLVKNAVTRMSRHVIAETTSEAIEKAGWSQEDVLYAMIVKMIAARPMREETKIRLRKLGAEKKAERAQLREEREKAPTYKDSIEVPPTVRSGSRADKSEEVPMSARTLTATKTKTGVNLKFSRKEPGQFVGSLGLSLFGHSVASVIRWMGKNNFSFDQAMNALRHKNVSPLPRERYIKHLLSWGKAGERGAPAALNTDEMMVLHNAKNNGPSKTKTATKTVTKAKTRSANKKRKK